MSVISGEMEHHVLIEAGLAKTTTQTPEIVMSHDSVPRASLLDSVASGL